MGRRKLERIVFFGTPEFAVPSLDALVAAGRRPDLVVTQPARPAGRGARAGEPAVAVRAHEHGLEVVQVPSVKSAAFLASLGERRPSLAVVVAFGQLFPKTLLELPSHGCINLHASLLPKYRGAAPIQAALVAGERTTGVTTMLMEEALDAGPILLQRDLEIGPLERYPELARRLAETGAELLVETVDGWEAGTLEPRRQREESATFARRLHKEDGKIDWQMDAAEIQNRLRAYTPWPGLYAFLHGRVVKLLSVTAVDWEQAPNGVVGTYLGMRQGRLAVLCGGATILGLEILQRADRKKLRAHEFANGERLRVGDRFV